MKNHQDKAVVNSTEGIPESLELSRRHFLFRLASTGGLLVYGGGGLMARETISNVRVAAELIDDPGYARVLRNQTFHQWDSFCVPESGKGEVRRLRWMRENPRRGPVVLRLAIALEAIHPGRLEIFLPDSGKAVGGISFQRMGAFQMLEFSLSGLVARQAYSEGLGLRMVSGDAPLWILGGSAHADGNLPPMYLPHLFYAGESSGRYQLIERLQSAQMMAEFGRPLGCVLDGMMQLHRQTPPLVTSASIRKQWSLFIVRDVAVAAGNGVESVLPFAALARVQPDHPALKVAAGEWVRRMSKSDSLFRLESQQPPSAYDLAYPMAVLARQEPFRHLRSLAIQIVSESQPNSAKAGTPTPMSGRAWYLLGMVRVMEELPAADIPSPWISHLQQEASRLGMQQRPDGMWTGAESRRANAAEYPELILSLALAAAFASAVRLGHLDDSFRTAARKTLLTAEKNLTSDGYMMVGSPSDPLGADGVVLSPQAAGLMAQLMAALPD